MIAFRNVALRLHLRKGLIGVRPTYRDREGETVSICDNARLSHIGKLNILKSWRELIDALGVRKYTEETLAAEPL